MNLKKDLPIKEAITESSKEEKKEIGYKTKTSKESIKKKKLNYDLNNLLINSNREEIGGMVYNAFIEGKNEKLNIRDIREKIFYKISNIMPQDIIAILKDDNVIKKKYDEKKYYNFFTFYLFSLIFSYIFIKIKIHKGNFICIT